MSYYRQPIANRAPLGNADALAALYAKGEPLGVSPFDASDDTLHRAGVRLAPPPHRERMLLEFTLAIVQGQNSRNHNRDILG